MIAVVRAAAPSPSGAEVLDQAHELLLKFCALPSTEAGHAVILWAAATHALPSLPAAPRLAITSAVKRSGKTRLLDIIEGLVHDPLATMNATPAAVFRSLAVDHPPTLIIDEVDTIFGSKRVAENNEDLRALINSGFQRGKDALRCVGPLQVPTSFPTFAMTALAGIGRLPDTISDRAINVRMKRRKEGEHVAPFRERRDRPALDQLREQLAEWLSDETVRARLVKAEPHELGLEDRAADVFEALVMVADEAGAHWPARARAAGKKLSSDAAADDEDESDAVRLLHDLRGVFDLIRSDHVPTEVILQNLRGLDEAPWAEMDLTGHRLGRLLAEVGIRSVRDRAGAKRGYRRAAFADAWARYPEPELDTDGDDDGDGDGDST